MPSLLRPPLALLLAAAMSTAGSASPVPEARRRFPAGYRPPGEGPVRVAFFDADSTLRVSRSGKVSANGPRDVMLLPGVPEKLAQLAADGYLVAVVSNQGGVGYGIITEETAEQALVFMARLLERKGAPVHWIDFAPGKDELRKPSIGMALALEEALQERFGRPVDWAGSFMVGDSAWKRMKDLEPDGTPGEDFSNSDRGFAENVRAHKASGQGFPFHHPRDFFGWIERGARNFRKRQEVLEFMAENPDF